MTATTELLAADGAPTPPVEPPAVIARRIKRPPFKVIAGAAIVAFFILLAIFGPLLAPHSADWQASTSEALPQAPSAHLLLGTDNRQHDLFSDRKSVV